MNGTEWLADEIERQNDLDATGKVGVFLTPQQWMAVVTRIRSHVQSAPAVDYSDEVTAEEVARIDELIKEEANINKWETIESETDPVQSTNIVERLRGAMLADLGLDGLGREAANEIEQLRAKENRDAREWNETVPALRAEIARLQEALKVAHRWVPPGSDHQHIVDVLLDDVQSAPRQPSLPCERLGQCEAIMLCIVLGRCWHDTNNAPTRSIRDGARQLKDLYADPK